jgi:hypothetical protein
MKPFFRTARRPFTFQESMVVIILNPQEGMGEGLLEKHTGKAMENATIEADSGEPVAHSER